VLKRFDGQWDALWIAVSELAVRLDALEKRLEENKSEEFAPSEKQDTDVVASNYRTDDELKEEFMILKRAFVAEKENLRQFVEILEEKVEAKMKDVDIETVAELKHKVNLLANEKTDRELSEAIQGRVRTVEKTLNSVQSIADALEKRTKLVETNATKMQDSSIEFESRLGDIETSVSTIMETQNRYVK
jgi:methyl-accepting chemotaxis protein